MEDYKFKFNKLEWKNFKLISFEIKEKPESLKDWLYAIWGYDIFCNGIPFLKVLILINILIWFILFWSK